MAGQKSETNVANFGEGKTIGCDCGFPYELDDKGILVCCNPAHGKIAPYQLVKNDFVPENTALRKVLEDIVECHDNLIELIKEAREILDGK